MKREIKHPIWNNEEKTQVKCLFEYEDGGTFEAVVSDTEEGNPDWHEIINTFSSAGIDENTEKLLADREKRKEEHKQWKKDNEEREKNEALFACKLEAFEIPEIRESKNRELKAKIRKAKSIVEVQSYATILLMKELENADK
jgi:hypothetical protein